MKTWSISTTVRNPERIPGFLQVIKGLEGRSWNDSTKLNLMYELIRNRLYRPNDMSDEQCEMFEDVDQTMTRSQAKAIFDQQNYEDPPMRGRTAIAPLRDIGVVRVVPTVQISNIGKLLIDGKLSLQDVLLNYLLKWELPIHEHRTFSAINGYNIKPFGGVLELISRVNELWKAEGESPVGLSREEFDAFGPTLIDFEMIDLHARKILALRKAQRSQRTAAARQATLKSHIDSHLRTCLDVRDRGRLTEIHRNNLRDFGDNTIRYFRQSGFIEFRGAGRYIDIAEVVAPQANLLIKSRHAKPIGHDNLESYYNYMADLSSYVPPWATSSEMRKVKSHLRQVLRDVGGTLPTRIPIGRAKPNPVRAEDAEVQVLRSAIVKARIGNLKNAARNADFIDGYLSEYTRLLGRGYDGHLPGPVALEYNTFKALVSLNDAVSVEANYPVGDDGEPISHAPSGVCDLLCEYQDFVLSVEVTLSRGNNQWVMEGQPVQRHLRKIENEFLKPAYALFLAPRLHDDTTETFWHANIHGYQGKQQKIVALEISTWIDFLTSVKSDIVGAGFDHRKFNTFLEAALPTDSRDHSSTGWKQRINSAEFIMDFN
jgi:hypothetical protein